MGEKLNGFYRSTTALYELQFSPEGFEWINHADHLKSVVSFVRKGKKEGDYLVVVCNFTPVPYPDFRVGVPVDGTYTEVLNSDDTQYGGAGDHLNANPLQSEAKEWDGKEHSIGLVVPPLGMVAFEVKKAVAKKKKKS
ncbi:MAG: alpha amylase C-terminal domain-containing protein [Saprospiraceae bacterium]